MGSRPLNFIEGVERDLTIVVDSVQVLFARITDPQMSRQIVRVGREFVLVSLAFIGLSSPGIAADTVIVYSALDQEFAQPVLKTYGEKSGVRVLPKFDVESTKTVGLTNLIIADADRPRCDRF